MRYLIPATVLFLALPHSALAQHAASSSRDDMIANAMSAAPHSVSSAARIMLMDGSVLRTGDNGWTCIPDDPGVPNNSPMCVDDVWLAFLEAYMNRKQPTYERIGIGYMLQGDFPASNTDPFATAATRDNQWLQEGVPHIMLLVPGTTLLETLPGDPHRGGPWVMWKGTPYAHIMVPAEPRTTQH
jgi:hypothetical protein